MTGGRRWLLLIVLAAVAAVNLVQFRSIEAVHGGVGYAALGRLPSSDIVTLARANARIDGIYGMYLDLREASPRAEITTATQGVLRASDVKDVALGFGDAASVTVADYDDAGAPSAGELLDQGGTVAAEGSTRAQGLDAAPWQLITGDCGVGPGPAEGRSLVIVRWGSGADLAIGLIEACLLPDGFTGAAR
jgi:hypothetical protein